MHLIDHSVVVDHYGPQTDGSIVFALWPEEEPQAEVLNGGQTVRRFLFVFRVPVLEEHQRLRGTVAAGSANEVSYGMGRGERLSVKPRDGLLWRDVKVESDITIVGLEFVF